MEVFIFFHCNFVHARSCIELRLLTFNLKLNLETASQIPNSNFIDFFTSTKFDKIGTTSNVSCLANTSEQCTYQWQATEVGTNNPVVIQHQTISLIPQHFEIYSDVRCLATCNIRGSVCRAQPMEFRFALGQGEINTGKLKILRGWVNLTLSFFHISPETGRKF